MSVRQSFPPPFTLSIGSAITSGTSGSVLFVDASGNLGQDNANFFWDDSNNRLGIGTASPHEALHIFNGGNIKLGDGNAIVWGGTAGSGGTDFQIGRGGTHVLEWYTDLTKRLTLGATGNFLINGFSSATVGLTVKGATSQTANLSEWQNSAGTILSHFDKDGKLGIGTDAIVSPVTLHVRGAGSANVYERVAIIQDNRAQATGVGGGIVFGAKYLDDGTYTQGAYIGMEKVNGTSGNFGFNLVLGSRLHGQPLGTNITLEGGDTTSGQTTIHGGLVVGTELGGNVPAYHQMQVVTTGTKTPLMMQGGSSAMEFWKDTTPTAAVSYGMATPGGAATSDLILSTYLSASGWKEALRLSRATQSALITVQTSTVKGMVIKGAASQTANLQEWQNSSGTPLVVIDGTDTNSIGSIRTGTSDGSDSRSLVFSSSGDIGQATRGAYFGIRGNEYTAIANQKGFIAIVAGNPSTPSGTDGTINFYTGAESHRMIIDRSGNVGIGTTSPASLLHLKHATAATILLDRDTSGTGEVATIVFATAGTSQFNLGLNGSLDQLSITDESGNFLFRITDGGSVGDLTISGTSALNGNVTIGGGASASELRFLEPSGSGSNYTAFKAQAQAGDVTYILPAADGTNGYQLTTNGSGTLSWAAAGSGGGSPGGSDTQVQYNDGGAFGGMAGVAWDDTGTELLMTAQATTATPLNIKGAASQTANLFEAQNSSAFVGFRINAALEPSYPNPSTGSGVNNELYGASAGKALTTGYQNTAVGKNALFSATEGFNNVAIGHNALVLCTTGNHNTAVGQAVMGAVTTGANLTAVGANALAAVTSGENLTAIGTSALLSNTTGVANTAVGRSALAAVVTGNDNTAVGDGALEKCTGGKNVAVGHYALQAHTSGEVNTAVGDRAMQLNTTGDSNTAVGESSLSKNISGYYNTAIGRLALRDTTGIQHTGVGYGSLFYNTSGQDNTAIGSIALLNNLTGSYNTGLGASTGLTNTTGTYITLVGFSSDTGADGLTNATAIGANSVVGASNSLVLGGNGANAVKVGINDTTPDAMLDIVISGSSVIGQIIQGATSQSANLQEWHNSSSTILSSFDAAGRLRFNTASAGVTNEGSLWNDSTQKAIQIYEDGIEQTLSGVIFTATASATAAVAADTSIIGSGVGTVTLPANFFVAGKTVRIKAYGHMTDATMGGSVEVKLKLGATTLATSGAQSPGILVTDAGWEIEAVITCRTTGASGTVFAQGRMLINDNSSSSYLPFAFWMTNTGTDTIDTTASLAIGLTSNSADDGMEGFISVTSTNVTVEVLN